MANAYNKLKQRIVGPCEVLKKIHDNAYKVKLPDNIKTADMFNVADLKLFKEEEDFDGGASNSRTNFFQARGSDEDINLIMDFEDSRDQLEDNLVEMALLAHERFEGAKQGSLRAPYGPKTIK